jgi:hypothetical protein
MKRLHLDRSSGHHFYWLCECEGPCVGFSALFNWHQILLLRVAGYFGAHAQALLRRRYNEVWEKKEAE